MPRITINELISILENPDDSENGAEIFEKYFGLVEKSDMESSEPPVMLDVDDALSPGIKINTDEVDIQADDTLVDDLIEKFNEGLKTWRQRRYSRKIELFESRQWDLVKIVSEGDSWFQYPVVRDDIIDQIFEPRTNFIFNKDNPYAVFSLGNAGAKLEEMNREEEYIEALREVKPSWFMLSGGGNDLLDNGKGFKDLIRKILVENSGRAIEDYIVKDKLDERLNFVMGLYQKIFTKVTQETEFNDVKILCHGYDYVRPSQTGIILGKRMKERNINNETTMFEIIKFLIDRFKSYNYFWCTRKEIKKGVSFWTSKYQNGNTP